MIPAGESTRFALIPQVSQLPDYQPQLQVQDSYAQFIVYNNGAGTAVPFITTALRTFNAKFFSEHFKKYFIGSDLKVYSFAIQNKIYFFFHLIIPISGFYQIQDHSHLTCL